MKILILTGGFKRVHLSISQPQPCWPGAGWFFAAAAALCPVLCALWDDRSVLGLYTPIPGRQPEVSPDIAKCPQGSQITPPPLKDENTCGT